MLWDKCPHVFWFDFFGDHEYTPRGVLSPMQVFVSMIRSLGDLETVWRSPRSVLHPNLTVKSHLKGLCMPVVPHLKGRGSQNRINFHIIPDSKCQKQ